MLRKEVVISDFPEQPVVVLQPDRVLRQPCPHLVYLVADVAVWVDSRRRLSNTFTWLHTWFREHDPRQSALWFFWETVEDTGGTGEYKPSFPYRLRHPVREGTFQLDGKRDYRVTCQGHAICSVDAEGFCKELQARDALSYDSI
jgi:hypothetical protein